MSSPGNLVMFNGILIDSRGQRRLLEVSRLRYFGEGTPRDERTVEIECSARTQLQLVEG